VTGSLVYLDSSAILKLVMPEPESAALFTWLETRSERVTSIVAHVEVRRATRRAGGRLRRAIDVLDAIATIPLDGAIVDIAGTLDPPELRSLDALHLATALSVGVDLAGLVTYDDRLGAAAARRRIEVWAPTAL
jgi:hypothetical protein